MTARDLPDQWWLAASEDLLVWARLRVLPSGATEVFGARGETLRYDDEDSARTALLDADFRAFDGIDEDDAVMLGSDLDSLTPPEADSDAELVPHMTEKLVRSQVQ